MGLRSARVFTNIVKPLLLDMYLRLPKPVSVGAYSLGRLVLPLHRPKAFEKAFNRIASYGPKGDYLEFGVYRGDSFIKAYKLAITYGFTNMRFFAFDSFQGLPGNEGHFRRGDYAFPKQLFHRMIDKAGVDVSRVITVEGWFSDSLQESVKTQYALKTAAIIHVDCDLYESAREVLRFIEDVVHIGTILIFDDWYSFSSVDGNSEVRGEEKAFTEWPSNRRFEPFDKYEIVRSH